MLIPSLSNFLPDHPCTSRCLDQFSILILRNLAILIQELQEYLDHILLQLVDVVRVLLQGVTNRCLDDGNGGDGVLMVLLLMTIVLSANALMWSMVTKTGKKGMISSISRMLMMVLTMFMMILTMVIISRMVMILEEGYLKMVNCHKVREEGEDILNLDRGALLQELHRQLDVVLFLDHVPGNLSHRIKQHHIQEERQRHISKNLEP